eukprot:1727534-Amphidinium_carterae.1
MTVSACWAGQLTLNRPLPITVPIASVPGTMGSSSEAAPGHERNIECVVRAEPPSPVRRSSSNLSSRGGGAVVHVRVPETPET